MRSRQRHSVLTAKRRSRPDEKELRVTGEGFFAATDRPPATDDWPFVYLPKKSFPAHLPPRTGGDPRDFFDRNFLGGAARHASVVRLAHVLSRSRLRASRSESPNHFRASFRQHLERQLARLLRHPHERVGRRPGQCAGHDSPDLDFLSASVRHAGPELDGPSGSVALAKCHRSLCARELRSSSRRSFWPT